MEGSGSDLDHELVHYRCVTPDHQSGRGTGSGITVWNGRWAYCAAGGVLSQHSWAETGGVTVANLRASDDEYDNTLLAALSAAETLFADLDHSIGATTFRLELARRDGPLTIDVGQSWPLLGRALLDIELRDGRGVLGRALVGDQRRDDYSAEERVRARQVVGQSVPTIRRWLSARAARRRDEARGQHFASG